MVSFSDPYLRVLRAFLFEACMVCFIVTFHVTTFDKGNRLVADSSHRFCARHRQHKCMLVSPLCLKLAIFGINFKARHDFRLLRKRYRLSARVVAIDTHNLRDRQSLRPTLSEGVVIVMLLLQLLIGPLDWTRKIETTSNRKTIYSTKSRNSKNSLGSRSEERRVGKECRSRWSPYH